MCAEPPSPTQEELSKHLIDAHDGLASDSGSHGTQPELNPPDD